jgi:hypothetical protein
LPDQQPEKSNVGAAAGSSSSSSEMSSSSTGLAAPAPAEEAAESGAESEARALDNMDSVNGDAAAICGDGHFDATEGCYTILAQKRYFCHTKRTFLNLGLHLCCLLPYLDSAIQEPQEARQGCKPELLCLGQHTLPAHDHNSTLTQAAILRVIGAVCLPVLQGVCVMSSVSPPPVLLPPPAAAAASGTSLAIRCSCATAGTPTWSF